MLLQNYRLDMGYTYNFTKFLYRQSFIVETATNENPLIVLQTLLPTINGQLITVNDNVSCPLRQGLTHRNIEIELASNNTRYVFDIPWNSTDTVSYNSLLADLSSPLIKSWTLNGEKVTSRLIGLLLTKVP